MTPFLAVDWGTSNLRAWRLDGDGGIEAELDLPLGVARLPRAEIAEIFEARIRGALDRTRELPTLMCGMIGSNIGWQATPYISCPATVADVVKGVVSVHSEGPPVRIVPGLRCAGMVSAPDVMRGEETQVLGWLALDPARSEGSHLICHPGTHAKWVAVKDGAIERFVTAMTGELFDVLLNHSILAGGAVTTDQSAFAAGLEAAGDGGALAARLFSVRSRIVAGGADANTSPSYLSGLLIGAEIAAMPGLMDAAAGSIIHVVGSPDLCAAYQLAFGMMGRRTSASDGEAASIAGLRALVAAGALE